MRIGKLVRDSFAAERQVGAVVRQADARRIRQDHQVVTDDPCFPQFDDGVDLTTTNALMGEEHVSMFCFAVVPARETRADKEFAIEGVRNAVVQFTLPHGWMRSKVHRGLLPDSFEVYDL